MTQEMNLPKEYVPYEALNLCSNVATNYKVPIGAKNYAPILIGKGDSPLIWIAVNNPENSEEWRYIVSMNKSLHPNIKVDVNPNESSVIVSAGNDILLNVVADDLTSARVISIDLRPIGLNIIGSENGLQVGGSQLSNNGFSNVGTVIGLG